MSIFDLQKRQEAVRFVLEKRNLPTAPVMRVGAAFDVSGSAKWLYVKGIMQATVDRLIPVAMKFDDNGEMDVWAFDDEFAQLPTVGKMDYEDYIQRAIMNNTGLRKWNTTKYGGVWKSMIDFYFPGSGGNAGAASGGGFLGGLFGGKKAAPAPAAAPAASGAVPAMILFITDGANADRSYAEQVLRAAQNQAVYFQMIGVGDPSEFDFIKKMADDLPNVGFVHLASLDISDEQLYDALLTDELVAFAKRF
jgi:hypothetical protein